MRWRRWSWRYRDGELTSTPAASELEKVGEEGGEAEEVPSGENGLRPNLAWSDGLPVFGVATMSMVDATRTR